MKLFRMGIGMIALVGFVSAAAWACDKGGCTKTATTASAPAEGQQMKGDCHKGMTSTDPVDQAVARVLAEMPRMSYRVGDFETKCPHAAKAKADETKTAIAYVVDGQAYPDRAAAMNKLAELWNAKLPEVTQVAYLVNDETIHCPKAAAEAAEAKHAQAQPMVAGVAFDCPMKAQAVADKLAAKIKDFSLAAADASKGEAKAMGGCTHAHDATTASADGAKAKSGGCGGCSHHAADAATAKAADTGKCGDCKGDCQTATADDDTPALANAKNMVRQVVEFVVAAKQAPDQS